ncbi:MAG: NAD-dependent epimerase/dehydratase family protein, partial [Verrucomicrobiaceae bacterium]
MNLAIVTGSAGLIGSETCKKLSREGFDILGVDNDMRSYFFGSDASTSHTRTELEGSLKSYRHHGIDIRNSAEVMKLFSDHGSDIKVVVHTAAQPSHDWA